MKLQPGMDAHEFWNYYFLKEELVQFCRENQLSAAGGKQELTDRIAIFLESGVRTKPELKKTSRGRGNHPQTEITEDTLIEPDFVCSERHREFFKGQIGAGFSFKVAFQKWLKTHTGQTYRDAVHAYYEIQAESKTKKTVIDRQFEYNTYIRDFFADNQGKSLAEAIECWNYKKRRPGHNRYEPGDLPVLKLVKPSQEQEIQVMEYRDKMLQNGDTLDGCAGLEEITDYAEWLDFAGRLSQKYGAEYVPSTVYLAIRIADGKLIGMADFRYPLSDFLRNYGGNIGYSICPEERRKGYAAELLRLVLNQCRQSEAKRVLLTCDKANTGSAGSVLANGGVLENEVEDLPGLGTSGIIQRYWIEL